MDIELHIKRALQLKKKYPEHVLLVRMGDFYESFGEDAKLLQKELGVILTTTSRGVEIAGVPYHSIHQYTARLIQKGHKVAVQETRRDVVRIITEGITDIPAEKE